MTKHPLHRDGAAAAQGNAGPPVTEEQPAVPFWQVLVLGLATLLFGVAVLTWPAATLRTIGVLVGIWLLVVGAARIVGAFLSGRAIGRQVLSAAIGIIFVVGGVACLRNVAKGVLVLAFIIAFAWILSGVAELTIALQAPTAARAWLIILAIVSIAIGFVFLFWPGLSLTTIVIMTGISGVIIGIGEAAFAFQLRRLAAAP
ncbi:HdeD family acid-resistance protein [Planosporangium mesophilum]|uniref:HdeD family acid-resistance protein n=1 Tax=Planosporangium mesophilum TaxID=689768 RepID=A0A8J3TDK4_9ACTN|nr:DUF308 domain-containing protein [Planosporangium mesophilum]NJC84138.1 HdeD family acid-resistance protein [Planosporangium mesophilum]GII22859.1 hypothetical protein Pme01_24560 [Planosporangium mesophilum]